MDGASMYVCAFSFCLIKKTTHQADRVSWNLVPCMDITTRNIWNRHYNLTDTCWLYQLLYSAWTFPLPYLLSYWVHFVWLEMLQLTMNPACCSVRSRLSRHIVHVPLTNLQPLQSVFAFRPFYTIGSIICLIYWIQQFLPLRIDLLITKSSSIYFWIFNVCNILIGIHMFSTL